MKLKMDDAIAAPFVTSLSFFSGKDLTNLLETSKKLNGAATHELEQRALLRHIVLGEQEPAEALIQAHPKWLSSQSIAQDYSGRTIVATPFQAAIGAGDKPMWEMILCYLGPEEAFKQFHAWFPHGIENNLSAKELQADYNAIALAIIQDEDNGLAAIERFREKITAQNNISQEEHFNLAHLSAAYQAYVDNFDALGDLNQRKFWAQVIGYGQRQVTAYDAQAHCFGIDNALDNENSFPRSFELDNEMSFFPLEFNPRLGFDFAVFSGRFGSWLTCGDHSAQSIAEVASRLNEYIEQKQKDLQALDRDLSYAINPSNYP